MNEIEIFPIANTVVNPDEVKKWLDHIGAGDYQVPYTEDIDDPALLVALAAKRCYMSFVPGLNPNVTKVREDLVDYLDNILKQGHGSVLEHATYTFAIEGVSRVFTAEMNRHRAGWAISEGSMRYIRFEDKKSIPFWMPLSLRDDESDDLETSTRKSASRIIMKEAFDHQLRCYKELLETWKIDEGNFATKKKLTSCFRRIIGMGVATGGIWTGNLRALRHVIAMRASEAAEEEICHVFTRIADYMTKDLPSLFGDFKKDRRGFFAPKYPKV
jgi:thymidylate synthase (FAD)